MRSDRIREIVSRHINALVEEITSEIEVAIAPLEAAIATLKDSSPEEKGKRRKYTCHRCSAKFDHPQELMEHTQTCVNTERLLTSSIPTRIPTHCIAEGCTEPHRGPRFRYLCVHHREADAAQIAAWQEKYRSAVSA